jgi:prepilin signal peptidase PulO-like enzyme (type II secretory pathway)
VNTAERILASFIVLGFGVFIGSVVNRITRYFLNEISRVDERALTSSKSISLRPVSLIHLARIFISRNFDSHDSKLEIRKEIMVELICGIGSLSIFLKFGLSPVLFTLILFLAMLIAIFRIDMEKMIIPDIISLTGVLFGFLLSSLEFLPDMNWKSSVGGVLLGATILYVPAYLYKLIKGADGLGGGDVKLMAMVGAFTGIEGTIFTLFVASFTGCLVGLIGALYRRISSDSLIPFGPFISSAAILYVLLGKIIITDFLHFPEVF